jgi:cell wall-associated NlpC family hydrolase
VAAALVASAAIVPTVASAAPGNGAQVKQSIASVQQRLDALARENDQLVEKYNQANNAYQTTKAAAAKASAVYAQAQRRLTEAQNLLAQSAAAQYEGGTYSATGALLSSTSGSSYLDQLDTLSMLSQHNAQIVSSFAVIQKQAKLAQRNAASLYQRATANRAALVSRRAATTTQIAKYKDLLATLNARQRAIWAAQHRASISAGTATTLTRHTVQATSSAAQAAVQFALAQVGKPYVFGAAGPDAYDCSGLTMASWQQGGVSLPHSAADQYNYGHHVSIDQLAPGDLIFMYQPIGHVTIYIGNGMMVSAPTEGEPVQVVSVQSFASDIVGATRLVG